VISLSIAWTSTAAIPWSVIDPPSLAPVSLAHYGILDDPARMPSSRRNALREASCSVRLMWSV
jgi:hypothetical protein